MIKVIPVTDSAERRHALGIPVHTSEEDHDWRQDGYCNCGASRSKLRVKVRGGNRVAGKSNLDFIEGNSEANF